MKNEKNEDGISYTGGFATSTLVTPENIPLDVYRLAEAVAAQQMAIEGILKVITTIGTKIDYLDRQDEAHAAAVKELVRLADDQAASLKRLLASVLRASKVSGSEVQ